METTQNTADAPSSENEAVPVEVDAENIVVDPDTGAEIDVEALNLEQNNSALGVMPAELTVPEELIAAINNPVPQDAVPEVTSEQSIDDAALAAVSDAINVASEDFNFEEFLEENATEAAGAGGEGEGHSYVRLDRIKLDVDPLEYEYGIMLLSDLVYEPQDPLFAEEPEDSLPPFIEVDLPEDEDPDPEDPDPEDPDPEDPDPEDPPVDCEVYVVEATGYIGGQGNEGTGGTYANANGLKETSSNNAEIVFADDGYVGVAREGNPHGETGEWVDPTEAVVLQLSEPTTTFSISFKGDIGGAQYSIYDETGSRIGGNNHSEFLEPTASGDTITITSDVAFSYIALDGGNDSKFAVAYDTESDITCGCVPYSPEDDLAIAQTFVE